METPRDRFDRLLRAMSQGEAPSARKSASGGQASGAGRGAFQRYSNSPRYFGRCFSLTLIGVQQVPRFNLLAKSVAKWSQFCGEGVCGVNHLIGIAGRIVL